MAIRPMLVCALVLTAPSIAMAAESWPSRPVRMIVGFTPGGSDDYVGRIVAERLAQRFGQPVIVDNRPGAGGNVGAEITARSSPDGYTLSSCGSITLASSPSLYAKLGYEPMKDFTFISRVAIGANVIFAHPSLPSKTLADVVTVARTKPKSISYGTPGVASLGHLAIELVQSMGKVQFVHVPYKGPAAAVTAVLGNEVQIGVGASTAAIPLVQAKRLQGLAVTSANRLAPIASVPTLAESGFPGAEVTNHHGIFGPAGISPTIVKLINAEIRELLQTAEVKSGLAVRGLELAGSTPEEFRQIVQSELTRWTRVIKEARITVN